MVRKSREYNEVQGGAVQHLAKSQSSLNVQDIIDRMNTVFPAKTSPLALHEPVFEGREWDYVKECIDTRWVSSVGKFVDKFELDLAEYMGAKHAVVVCNGTAALHICFLLAGVQQNDEVILPSMTFIATANAVSYCYAIPHFVDIEERTMGLDPVKLGDYLTEIAEVRANECFNRITGRRIKAVVPMHTFGHPVDLDLLEEVCKKFKLELVEDAAESLGTLYKGRHTGNWGLISAISFNGNKIITTGGGGAIVTNDEKIGKLTKHITTTAKLPHAWAFVHDRIAYNYRMPNLNAALGCAQLEQLAGIINDKRALVDRYRQAFKGIEGASFYTEPEFARSNYWLNALILNNPDMALRDKVLESLRETGYLVRPAWTLMHKLVMYNNCPRMDLPVSERLEAQIINLPSSAFI